MYGEIKIWSGPLASIPSGYCLADGRELSQTEYPNLYAVLGDTYNTQHKGNKYTYGTSGDNYTTTAGKFRIPDLSSRFIWGCGSNGKTQGSDIDGTGYDYAAQGGLSSYKLSGAQSGIQSHSHNMNHVHSRGTMDITGNLGEMIHSELCSGAFSAGTSFYRTYPDGTWKAGYPDFKASRSWSGVTSGPREMNTYNNPAITDTRDTTATASESHENKPPFIVLAYIIRIK